MELKIFNECKIIEENDYADNFLSKSTILLVSDSKFVPGFFPSSKVFTIYNSYGVTLRNHDMHLYKSLIKSYGNSFSSFYIQVGKIVVKKIIQYFPTYCVSYNCKALNIAAKF